MITLYVLFIALLALGIIARRWGVDSSDGINSLNWYMQATAVLMQHVRDINALDKDQQGQTNLRHPPARHKQRRKPFFPYHKRQNHAQLEKGRSLSRAFTLASSLCWLRTPFHAR